MKSPAFVCLDTSTWAYLARDVGHDGGAVRVLSLLNGGDVIPFITGHHVLELAQHESDREFEIRVAFLRTLKFVGFHRIKEEKANVGYVLELRELEIRLLLECPSISNKELIERVREKLINGFTTGAEFCAMNEEWWALYRKEFAPRMRAREAEIASVTQIPTGNRKEKLPPPNSTKLRSREEATKYIEAATSFFAQHMEAHGDDMLRDLEKRLNSPEALSRSFHAEVIEDGKNLYAQPGDPLENLLAHFGVKRSRLPKNATIEDVGYEATFVGNMQIHERRLALPAGALAEIRQDDLPSWIVWREVDRAMKNHLLTAEGSSLADKMIVSFGLYLDGIELDKRLVESVRQSVGRGEMLRDLYARVFRRKNWKQVGDLLNEIRRTDSNHSPRPNL